MATPAPVRDLWPDDLARGPILTPLAILRVQAARLRTKTGGLLEAEIKETSEEDRITYAFDLVAPALDRYRHGILHVTHGKRQVYPAKLASTYLPAKMNQPNVVHTTTAYTQEAFMEGLASIFGKAELRAVIDSILAQSNESSGDRDSMVEAS